MKYLANFDGEEFAGKFYDAGDEIKGVDEDTQGAMDALVARGRATAIEDGDEEVPAVGDGGKSTDTKTASKSKK